MPRIARVAILALAALIGLAGWKGLDALLGPSPIPGIQLQPGEKPMTPKVVKTDKEWKENLTPNNTG